MKYAFQFTNVCKTFRSHPQRIRTALDAVSFTGEASKITCLLGPTGSGKTTLLRLLAGLEQSDSGMARLGNGLPRKGDIAYQTQQHTLLPWKRILENIALPLELKGMAVKERHRIAQEVLESVGLYDINMLYPHELSGGMQQRAMLARTITSGSTYWLMDEPFAALDEPTRYTLQDLLLEQQRARRASVLFVTHNIEQAVYLADKVVVLSLGPGRVVNTLAVELSRPRDRLSTQFATFMEELRRSYEAVILEQQE